MKKIEKKLVGLIKKFSSKKLEEITRKISFDKLDKKTCKKIMCLIWINLGKDVATEKEIKTSLSEVGTLMTLELFERQGLVKRNKKGMYKRTKLGNNVLKEIN